MIHDSPAVRPLPVLEKEDLSMIRLIALDLDDTLLGPDLTVSPACCSVLQEAVTRGIKVTFASGRMYRSVQPYAEKLRLGTIPLITYNGALVRFAGYGKTIFHRPLEIEPARELILSFREAGLHINVFLNDELFMEKLDEEGKRYIERSRVKVNLVKDLSAVLLSGPTKILGCGPPEDISKLQKQMARKYRGRIFFTRSRPRFLECLAPGVNKGLALAKVAGFFGVAAHEVMAVGDAPNDLEMLKWAGIGVAMGNSPPEVQKAADWTAPPNHRDGVAAAFRRYILVEDYCH